MKCVYSEPLGHAISSDDIPLPSAGDPDASPTVSKGHTEHAHFGRNKDAHGYKYITESRL
jgi:hypothetical protein